MAASSDLVAQLLRPLVDAHALDGLQVDRLPELEQLDVVGLGLEVGDHRRLGRLLLGEHAALEPQLLELVALLLLLLRQPPLQVRGLADLLREVAVPRVVQGPGEKYVEFCRFCSTR